MQSMNLNEVTKKRVRQGLPSMSEARFGRCFSIYLDLRASGDSHSEAMVTIKGELLMESFR